MAKGEKIIYTDHDFPYTLESFVRIWCRLNEYDVVVGVKSATYYEIVPKRRRIISKLLQKTVKFIFRIPVSDTQCGLKGFNRRGKKHFLATTVNRYLFDLEFIVNCFRSKETPTITIWQEEIHLRSGVVFSSIKTKQLLKEVINLLGIVARQK